MVVVIDEKLDSYSEMLLYKNVVIVSFDGITSFIIISV